MKGGVTWSINTAPQGRQDGALGTGEDGGPSAQEEENPISHDSAFTQSQVLF